MEGDCESVAPMSSLTDALYRFTNVLGDVQLDAGSHTFEWLGFEQSGGAAFELSVAVGVAIPCRSLRQMVGR